MADSVSGGLELVGNSRCEHVCHQGVMPSHDANNDDAEMMIKRETRHCKSRCRHFFAMYSVRNLEMSICFSLKSRPSERFHRPEMSQIKAEISLHTNVKLNFHKGVGCQ